MVNWARNLSRGTCWWYSSAVEVDEQVAKIGVGFDELVCRAVFGLWASYKLRLVAAVLDKCVNGYRCLVAVFDRCLLAELWATLLVH